MGEDLIKLVQQFFTASSLPPEINETFIFLLPKGINPSKATGFRPFSLCNVRYRVIAKILVDRIKPFQNISISPF